ncbi:hypothetical protein AC45_2691 [Escherichia coli 2-210-07_S3_C3]|nr:hypothetical protein AC45_2691 [Escherichia coli 2-210-07_S3_C3]
MFAGKKSAQIREILISESAWEEMTCLFAPSLGELLIKIWNCDTVQIQTHKKTSSLALERFLADLITINYEAQKK